MRLESTGLVGDDLKQLSALQKSIMRPPSIAKIAENAGVSRNTVSLALRNDRRVAAATRDRVLKVASSLNYRPNLVARAMVTGRTATLGLVLPRLDFSYVPRLVEAIQERAFESQYGVLACSHHNRQADLEIAITYLLDRRVDGVLMYCPVPSVAAETWDQLQQSECPTVFFSFGEPSLPGATVELHPEEAGAIAVRKLADAGHKRLAYAGGRSGFFENARWQGVVAEAKGGDTNARPFLLRRFDRWRSRGGRSVPPEKTAADGCHCLHGFHRLGVHSRGDPCGSIRPGRCLGHRVRRSSRGPGNDAAVGNATGTCCRNGTSCGRLVARRRGETAYGKSPLAVGVDRTRELRCTRTRFLACSGWKTVPCLPPSGHSWKDELWAEPLMRMPIDDRFLCSCGRKMVVFRTFSNSVSRNCE